MKTVIKDIQLIQSWQGVSIVIPLPAEETERAQELKKKADEGKSLQLEIKPVKRQRSLNANAALWQLLGEMAAKLKTSKDELYTEMLARYGVFTHVVVKPNVVDRVKAEWRTVRELGEVTVNGQTGIQLQCYFGSSTYDTQEFTRLLDGVISEARELGITLISDADRALMLAEWGQKDG